MIILFGGQKGGTGKTTLSCNIAQILSKTKKETIYLADLDAQGSASKWFRRRMNSETVDPEDKRKIVLISTFKEVSAISESKFVVVDIGGKDDRDLRQMMTIAHSIICPIIPSEPDLDTIQNINDLNKKLREFRHNNYSLKILLNRINPLPWFVKTSFEKSSSLCKKFGLQMFENNILDSLSIIKSFSNGLGVDESNTKSSITKTCFINLYREIFHEKG